MQGRIRCLRGRGQKSESGHLLMLEEWTTLSLRGGERVLARPLLFFIKTQPDQQQVLSLDSYQCVSGGCSAVWWRGYSSLHGQHVWALIATVSVLGFTPVIRSKYVVESRIFCSTSCGQA